MDEDAISPKRTPLKVLLSIELCKDNHYREVDLGGTCFVQSYLQTTKLILVEIRGNLIYPTPPLGQDMTRGQFFKFYRFEFRVVLLLD